MGNESTRQGNAISAETQYDQFWKEWMDYNRYHPGARHRRRKIIDFLSLISFESVLDVGCGSGNMLKLIQSQFPNAKSFAGVDVSIEGVEAAKKLNPGMRFWPLNLEKDFIPEPFDLVICSEVIEHLHDQKTAFKHLSAMVKPGGYLLITCPSGKIYPTEKHFGHIHHPSEFELTSYATLNGMSVDRFECWGFPTYKLLKEATNFNPNWALKHFAQGEYGWRQKLVSNFLYWVNFFNFSIPNTGCQNFALFVKNKG